MKEMIPMNGLRNDRPPPKSSSSCGCTSGPPATASADNDGDVCCGSPPAPPAGEDERPGYRICAFVEKFVETPAGRTPLVKTRLSPGDRLGTIGVRAGFHRNHYLISPGLYGVGSPGPSSPVLVTANYKLSFDTLRKELDGTDAWILVLDTRGINVWCAAGKGTFSTDEVIRQVRGSGLEKIVSHRKLILPQLSATGVSAREVKKGCGFKVVWGPVRTTDIRPFLADGMKAAEQARRVTFNFWERLVLTPVEITLIGKSALWPALMLLVVSGFGPGFFSIDQAMTRGMSALYACMAGILGGAVLTPLLLPWLPSRMFAVKGIIPGLLTGIGILLLTDESVGFPGCMALILMAVSVSSYTAMNFTGATPFTSPSGVEKEMRKSIPAQFIAAVLGVILWVGTAFAG